METALIRQEPVALARHAVTVDDLRAQIAMIHNAMKAVMRKGVHYGTVPGCGDKPTLLKPGAEVIMALFRLAANPATEDLSDNDAVRYRVKVDICTASGAYLGSGVGECSSDEEKYKWKRPVCDEEWNETDIDRRREKWARTRDGKTYKTKQIRTSVADVSNTVLKMAKKRSLIDAILTCTAASDIFTQDLEDMPEGYGNGHEAPPQPEPGKPQVQPPQSKSSKQQQTPPPQGQPTDDEIREKLRGVLKDLAGNEGDIADLTEQYSGFQGNRGNIKSERDVDKLKGAWLRSTYGKAKKDWEAAGFGDNTAEQVKE